MASGQSLGRFFCAAKCPLFGSEPVERLCSALKLVPLNNGRIFVIGAGWNGSGLNSITYGDIAIGCAPTAIVPATKIDAGALAKQHFGHGQPGWNLHHRAPAERRDGLELDRPQRVHRHHTRDHPAQCDRFAGWHVHGHLHEFFRLQEHAEIHVGRQYHGELADASRQGKHRNQTDPIAQGQQPERAAVRWKVGTPDLQSQGDCPCTTIASGQTSCPSPT